MHFGECYPGVRSQSEKSHERHLDATTQKDSSTIENCGGDGTGARAEPLRITAVARRSFVRVPLAREWAQRGTFRQFGVGLSC